MTLSCFPHRKLFLRKRSFTPLDWKFVLPVTVERMTGLTISA